MSTCRQELCTHWSGDVCMCRLFGLTPNTPDWLADGEDR